MERTKAIEYALEYKDSISIHTQLDRSFQRIYAKIQHKELKDNVSGGSFILELFRNPNDGEYSYLDHMHFLENLDEYSIKPTWSTLSWKQSGLALTIFLNNEDLFEKLNDVIVKKRDEIRLKILDRIGGESPNYEIEEFEGYVDDIKSYYERDIKNMEEEMKEYRKSSNSYKDYVERIQEAKALLGKIKQS